MKKVDLKKILIGLAAVSIMSVMQTLTAFGQTKSSASNRVFEIVSVSKDSVYVKIVSDTKFYSLKLISGKESFAASSFSNLVDTVYWANGQRFWPGSEMPMPAELSVGAMRLKSGAVLKLYGFKAPANFKPAKVSIITEGSTEYVYDIAKRKWE